MSDEPVVDDARAFSALARDLAEQPDRDATAARILELVVQLIGCEWASIAELTPSGRMNFRYTTGDDGFGVIATSAGHTEAGLAWQAWQDRLTIRTDDLAAETRWSAWRERILAETPIRSGVAYCLILDNLVLGAMTLYSSKPGFFTDDRVRFADVYADHAAIALSRAAEHDKVENLQIALNTNREIAIAVGIIMARHALTESQAFDLLRTMSQATDRKVRHLAADVTLTGDLPEWVTRSPK